MHAQANITPVPTNQLTLHQLAKWGNTDQAPRLREWHDEGCLNIYRDRPRQPQFDLSPGMGQTTPPKYWTNLTEEQRVDISITLLAEAAELGPACLAGKIDRYFARCDSACSTSDTEIARLRALRRRRGRPAPINTAVVLTVVAVPGSWGGVPLSSSAALATTPSFSTRLASFSASLRPPSSELQTFCIYPGVF